MATVLSIAFLVIGFALAQTKGTTAQAPVPVLLSLAAGTPATPAQASAEEPNASPVEETAAASGAGTEAAAPKEAEAAPADGWQARTVSRMRSTTQAQREQAAKNAARRRAAAGKGGALQSQPQTSTCGLPAWQPCGTANYFTSTTPNYALSRFTETQSSVDPVLPKTFTIVTGIRKFQNGLAGLGPANQNDLLNYIPIAKPMINVWGNGGDYYEIGLQDYTQKLHTDIPATQLRGYADLNGASSSLAAFGDDSSPHYLGPMFLATRGTRVRVKFRNMLSQFLNQQPNPPAFFLPADQSYMGMSHTALNGTVTWFSINRAVLHLHGGATPWISDGTPHQWTVPESEYGNANVLYKRGASVQFVPDMYFNPTTHAAEAKTTGSVNDPGPGALSFLWTNDQSGRLMFYHDHAYGITRLNFYAGEAGVYLLHDPLLDALIDTGSNRRDIPNNAMLDKTLDANLAAIGGGLTRANGGLYHFGIPLVIQDKTFVPPQTQLEAQDPTWNASAWGGEGNLWFPHVYMPNQNPNDDGGAAVMGRWDYGPWFWPPMTSADLAHGAITCQGAGDTALPTANPPGYGSGATCPGTLNPSGVPESFMDTPLVNGVPYPKISLPAGAYRFQVLNAANDRMFNLSLFYAADAAGNVCTSSAAYQGFNYTGGANTQPATAACTEVKMVPAVPHPLRQSAVPAPVPPPGAETPADPDDPVNACAADSTHPDVILGSGFLVTANPSAYFYNANTGLPGSAAAPCWPSSWPTDSRDGGVPDPATAGPPWVQIGTEGGVLPAPVVIPATPVGYNYNRRDVVVTNVQEHALFLGPAERADVIADFTNVPVGSSLILYNDSPAPVPGYDVRLDYYTGAPDFSSTGGAKPPQPGYGPNIRTIMRIDIVASTTPQSTFNLTNLKADLPGVFKNSQPAIIVPETTYPAGAINGSLPANDTYARIQNMSLTYTPTGAGSAITIPLQPKAIHELFENDYGKMNSVLAEEIPLTNYNNQTTIPLAYVDPPTEIVSDGETQLWKVTHNGVDSHAIHFHLFNVQLINRVGWDGAIRPPDPNELGWKETVRMNPLEDAFVALKPVKMALPTTPDFRIPESSRLLDVTREAGATNAAGMVGFTNVDPNGNPVTTVNATYDFGWEYVWHCHLLGHEESDMMRPIVFKTAVPDAPTNLTAANGTSIALAWSYTQGTNPATGFQILRSAGAGAFVQLSGGFSTNAAARTFLDTNVVGGTSYQYIVYAIAGSALSAPSNSATATAASVLAPTNFRSVLTCCTSPRTPDYATLAWNNTNPAGLVTSFTISRCQGTSTNCQNGIGGASWSTPAMSVAGTTTTRQDTGPFTKGQPYTWRIQAVAGAQVSPFTYFTVTVP